MSHESNFRKDSFSPFPYRSRETINEIINDFISNPMRSFTEPVKPVTGSWLLNNSRWPFIRLDLSYPRETLLQEAKRLLQKGSHHLENGSHDWLAFSILDNRGFAINDSIDLLESLYDTQKFDFTEGCDSSFAAWKLAEQLPLEKILAVQYFVLKKGGLIIPHSDTPDLGLTRFNFCLEQPENSFTYFENYGTIPYENDSVFIFDPSVKHAAINSSDTDRYYLQISGVFGKRTGEMHRLLESSFKKFYQKA